MSILKFKGHKAASGKNVSYITRESACESISFYNLNELESVTLHEKRVNAISYACNREEEETGRSHYRVILSWDRTDDTEKAQEMAHEFLDENFKDSRAVIAIHQDNEDQTHAHIWIDARQKDGRKIHSEKNHLNELCQSWQRQYDREYGTERAQEFAQKREETRRWKENKHKGIDQPKPQRVEMSGQDFREKDERDRGVKSNGIDESATGRDQRSFEVRDSKTEEADRGIAGSQQNIEKSERNVKQSGGNLEQSNQRIERAKRAIAKLQSRSGEVDERFNELGGRISEINRERELEDKAREIGQGFRERSQKWRARANPEVFGKDTDKNKDRGR